ncbi:MAG: nickel pincer cofactor biosynthesis protein LarB [Methanobrevibacter sp.]|nr:nickel pincer cofactor biosynthesis protein LarB [Methanobrevibacter sp.]
MREILEKLLEKKITIKEAEKLLKVNNIKQIQEIANFDISRKYRSGFPEAVLAKGKVYSDLLLIIQSYLNDKENKDKLIVTKLDLNSYKKIKEDTSNTKWNIKKDFNFQYNEKGKILIIKRKRERDKIGSKKIGKNETKYKIGLITAGTSDIPIAEEVRIISEEGGCEVVKAYDIGIAGIHRLFPEIKKMIKEDVKVIVVCAGMEGALSSVVAGLVNVPVLGVPTSVGYGIGADGKAAIYGMLQSCVPGLAVENIDNGFGAAIFALTIIKLLEDN